VAIDDLNKLLETGDYTFEPLSWHQPREDDICEVCLAGAIMARDTKGTESKGPGMYPAHLQKRFMILDGLRMGQLTNNPGFPDVSVEARVEFRAIQAGRAGFEEKYQWLLSNGL